MGLPRAGRAHYHDATSAKSIAGRRVVRAHPVRIITFRFPMIRGVTIPQRETGGCNHPFSGATVENLSELNSTYRHISGRG